ncbi:MAG TPA: MFS transporter [Pseudonocardia sp.]
MSDDVVAVIERRRAAEPRSGSGGRVAALVGLSLGAFAFVTLETLPIGLLEPIRADLGVSEAAIGSLVSVYAGVVVVSGLPLTYLLRTAPRRRVIAIVLLGLIGCTVGSAAAPTYGVLVASRIGAALSQSLFWSLVVPTAGGIFPPSRRGRAVAMVFAGASIAAIAGLPAGTWLGQLAGWRAAFVGVAVVGIVALGLVVAYLPDRSDTQSRGEVAERRPAGPYLLVVAALALLVTGSFTFFTYLSPYLTDVAMLSAGTIAAVLFVRGAFGVVGVWLGGLLVDRVPGWASLLPAAAQAVALLGLFAIPTCPPLVVVLTGVTGLVFSMVSTVGASRIPQVAPGDLDLASSGASTAVNIGIGLGALLGSLAVIHGGPATPPAVAAVITALGVALVLVEQRRATSGRSPLRDMGVR